MIRKLTACFKACASVYQSFALKYTTVYFFIVVVMAKYIILTTLCVLALLLPPSSFVYCICSRESLENLRLSFISFCSCNGDSGFSPSCISRLNSSVFRYVEPQRLWHERIPATIIPDDNTHWNMTLVVQQAADIAGTLIDSLPVLSVEQMKLHYCGSPHHESLIEMFRFHEQVDQMQCIQRLAKKIHGPRLLWFLTCRPPRFDPCTVEVNSRFSVCQETLGSEHIRCYHMHDNH